MRRLQLLLLLVGIGLFVAVVRKVGVPAVVHGFREMGASLAAIFAVELVIDALHSEAWHWCIPREHRTIPRFDLLAARTAGVAVNVLTPTATVGGEVLKGALIRRWVPLVDGYASVMVDKLTFAVAQCLFLLLGLLTVFETLHFGPRERFWAIVGVGLWVVAVAAFFALQRAGLFRVGFAAMRAVFGAGSLVDRVPGHGQAFDARVAELLAAEGGDLLVSIALHLVAQAARALQFYVALSALDLPTTLASCFTTAAGLVFIEATLFLVPAKLGVLEGGTALIFSKLGYGAAAGFVVSFALRLSELAAALLGLVALAYYHFLWPAKQGPPEEFPAAPSVSNRRSSRVS